MRLAIDKGVCWLFECSFSDALLFALSTGELLVGGGTTPYILVLTLSDDGELAVDEVAEETEDDEVLEDEAFVELD